jgi:hypothetical protein
MNHVLAVGAWIFDIWFPLFLNLFSRLGKAPFCGKENRVGKRNPPLRIFFGEDPTHSMKFIVGEFHQQGTKPAFV